MAINIPTIQRTQISTDVRRADVGIKSGQQTSTALAGLGDVVGSFANKLLQMREQDAKVKLKQDSLYEWANKDLEATSATSTIDGSGTVENKSGQRVSATEHAKELYKVPLTGDEEIDSSNQLNSAKQIARINAIEQKAKAEGTIASFKNTNTQLARNVLLQPSLSSANDYVDEQINSVNSLEASKVINAEQAQELRDHTSTIVKSFLTGYENEKGATATLKLYDKDGPYVKYLKPEEIDRSVTQLHASIKMQQTEHENNTIEELRTISEQAKKGYIVDSSYASKLLKQLPTTGQHAVRNRAIIQNAQDNILEANFNQQLYSVGPSLIDVEKSMKNVPAEMQDRVRMERYANIQKFQDDLSKKGGTYLATVNPKIALLASKMSANPQEFKKGFDSIESYMKENGVTTTIDNVVPKNLFHNDKVIFNQAIASNNPEVVLDVMSKLQNISGDKFPQVFDSLFEGGNIQVRKDIQILGKVSEESDRKELARVLLNSPKTKPTVKEMEALQAKKNTFIEDSRLDFVGTINSSDTKALETRSNFAMALAKAATFYENNGQTPEQAGILAFKSLDSSYNFIKADFSGGVSLAIPKSYDADRVKTVLSNSLDFRDPTDDTLKRMALLQGVEDITEEDRKRFSAHGQWVQGSDGNLGLLAIDYRTGLLTKVAFKGKEPFSISFKELENIYKPRKGSISSSRQGELNRELSYLLGRQ